MQKKLIEKTETETEVILIFTIPPTPQDEMCMAEVIYKKEKKK
ncbi:MAG: hypothetical protein WC373_13770 [Smithella sp.]